MANLLGEAGAVQLQLPWQHTPTAALLSAEFPLLHSTLRFSRREVDSLGGLHLLRADYVEYLPALAPHQPPHAVHPPAHAVPHSIANVIPDATLELICIDSAAVMDPNNNDNESS